MGKYLDFVETVKSKSGKTSIYEVVSNQQGTPLGMISWYGAWRKYVFFPALDTLFDVSCLNEITAFVTKLMEERKNGSGNRE